MPYPRIVVFLVGAVFAFRVADLALPSPFFGFVIIPDPVPERPLHVRVDAHFVTTP